MAKSEIKNSKKSASKKQEEKATKALKQKKEESSDSESSSSSSSSSSESESDSDSDSDSDSSSSEEEKKEEKKEESSDSDSDSDSDSSDAEEEKKEEKKEESSDSDSDSDSDSSDAEEEKKEESSDSDSDSSSSDEEEEENPKKRKAEEESASESPEPEAKKSKTEDEPATLFVGRLSWNIDDDWLKREFEKYDGVISARVISDRQSGRSKGYGYVDFASKEVAEKALAEMQGVEIDGRPINIDLSTSKPKQQNSSDRSNDRAKKFGDAKSEPSDTLFIGNLSFDSTRDSVNEFFAEFEPLGVRLPTHPETEQLKGFGYVQFGSVESAQSALDSLNGEYLNNRAVRLDFSTPKPQNNGGRSFGGRGGFGGRDRNGGGRGARGGFGGNRNTGSGANSTPVAFKGNKKTFD